MCTIPIWFDESVVIIEILNKDYQKTKDDEETRSSRLNTIKKNWNYVLRNLETYVIFLSWPFPPGLKSIFLLQVMQIAGYKISMLTKEPDSSTLICLYDLCKHEQ